MNNNQSEEKELVPLDSTKVAMFLSDGGSLSKLKKSFEKRPTQIELLKSICKSFNNNKIGIFEAGTGVGKSFAYLIPAILWSLENNERVVISTGTINLQQQLYENDIPATSQLLGKSIKAVLIKGRQNFICMRRLNDAIAEKDLFTDEKDELNTLFEWAKVTKTGSKSDLAFLPKENIWQRVNSESDACMGKRCPYHEVCFVMRMRKNASEANLLIVNHHMLFADIEARFTLGYEDTAVLPPYKYLIFDEAHGIENAATSFFSERITRFKFLKQLNLLFRMRRGAIAGHFLVLEALSSEIDSVQALNSSLNRIKQHIEDMENSALNLLGTNFSWRLTSKTSQDAVGFLYLLQTLFEDITKYTNIVRSVIEGIDDDDQQADVVWESKKILSRLDDIGGLCKKFSLWEEHKDTVFWIEKKMSRDKYYPQLYQTPLNIAPLMNEGVYEPLKTVICTSATLQIAGSFKFWMQRNGVFFVDSERIIQGEYASPFPYKTNLLLSIPKDAPYPNTESFQSYIENMILKLCKASNGRTLVLFTSYESLRSAWNTTVRTLAENLIKVYKQGDDDRFRLLEAFKNDKNSVLFATDSFWEGVDVPGESLSQVIIIKLPFSVPNDPIYSARAEYIEKKGENAFMQLSVPSAVIKFRQGVGRLLRHSTDFGSVVVLDKRLLTKQYGSLFLKSIPETKTCFDTSEQIILAVENFLK